MKRNLAGGSWLLFGVSVIFLITLTLFEAVLASASPTVERAITLLLLVVPPVIGAALGAQSLGRQERPRWMAVTGLVLNTLFALFHLAIVLFAG